MTIMYFNFQIINTATEGNSLLPNSTCSFVAGLKLLSNYANLPLTKIKLQVVRQHSFFIPIREGYSSPLQPLKLSIKL